MKRIFSIIIFVFVISSLCCQVTAQSREAEIRQAKQLREAEYQRAKQLKEAEYQRAKQRAAEELRRAKDAAQRARQQSDAQTGMLKAFGLKGKVRYMRILWEGSKEAFTNICFDENGNVSQCPNYDGSKVSIRQGSVGSNAGDIDFIIDNWKWTQMNFEKYRYEKWEFRITAYDQYNRPAQATLSCRGKMVNQNVAISYSDFDSHGNYTTMSFTTKNGGSPKKIHFNYEYWPQICMTNSQTLALIKRANSIDETALTKDFWDLLTLEASIPQIVYYEDATCDFFADSMRGCFIMEDDVYLDMESYKHVIITEDKYSDDGKKLDLYINLDGGHLYDRDNRHAICVFEDGKWKVDDFANLDVKRTYPTFEADEIWVKKEIEKEIKNRIERINSGEFEREVRQRFARDPKLPQYLATVQAFKDKINGTSGTSSSGNQIFTEVEEEPKFPGGDRAMYDFLSRNIRYPEMAAQNNIQGRVTVQFVVEKDGLIGEVKVVRGKDPDLDKEAVRVVRAMPKFIPGKMNGEAVRCWYTLPVNFRLVGDIEEKGK